MKIVIFGLTISSSWGNGHATLWRGLCSALDRRHHTVIFYERDVPYYAGARDCYDVPGGALVLYDDWETTRRRAAQDSGEADAVIVTSYCPDAIAAAELAIPRAAGFACFTISIPRSRLAAWVAANRCLISARPGFPVSISC